MIFFMGLGGGAAKMLCLCCYVCIFFKAVLGVAKIFEVQRGHQQKLFVFRGVSGTDCL